MAQVLLRRGNFILFCCVLLPLQVAPSFTCSVSSLSRCAGESSRKHWGGSRRLCGASRELWKGCKTFWKGSGRKILIFQCLSMVLGCQKSPGTSFEAGRTPRARALERRRVLQGAFGRLQEALWRFQRAVGRLQEIMEGFWAENNDFPMIFNGFRLPEIAGDQF